MSTTTLLDIITPDYLKKTSLLGVDLTTDDGAPFPNEIYETSIQASIQHIENDIGINLEAFKVSRETHDAERKSCIRVRRYLASRSPSRLSPREDPNFQRYLSFHSRVESIDQVWGRRHLWAQLH